MKAARRLAAGRLISLTSGSAAYIALIAALYGSTGSAAWVSGALFAGVVGSVAGAPAAGWFGDRYDRRRVMIWSDLVSAVVAAAMALVIDSPLALVLLFGLLAVAQSPFAPSSAAAIPNLVGEEDLPRANSLVAGTASLSYLLGPLLGGLLLGVGASAPELLAVDSVSFLVSAVFVASIRGSFGMGQGTESRPGVLEGVRVIVREPILRLLVTASMVSLVGIGIVNVANYPLSLELGGGTEGYGAMESLLGGGGLVGAALASRLLAPGRAPLIISVAFAVSAAGLLLAGVAPVIAVALAGMAVAGAGRGLGDVADTTLVQARTEDAVRSRVFAAQDGARARRFQRRDARRRSARRGERASARDDYGRRLRPRGRAGRLPHDRSWENRPDMRLARWEERLAPLDGIAAVGFWVAGVLVLQGPANQPDTDASAARALEFFTTEENAILVGTFLYMIGTLFFLWFLGLVRTRLVDAEGGSHRLSSIAFAGGVAAAISLLAQPAVHATGAINSENLSPDAAQVYLGINVAFFYAAEFATAVFLLALGLVSLRGQPFPRWFGAVSIVFAVWLVIPPVGWAVLLWGFPLWLIVVSVLLVTRSRTDSRPGPEHRTH